MFDQRKCDFYFLRHNDYQSSIVRYSLWSSPSPSLVRSAHRTRLSFDDFLTYRGSAQHLRMEATSSHWSPIYLNRSQVKPNLTERSPTWSCTTFLYETSQSIATYAVPLHTFRLNDRHGSIIGPISIVLSIAFKSCNTSELIIYIHFILIYFIKV